MRVLDLFSGVGAFSLGLERAGMKTISFCEIDPFCRRVLAKHWPGVPCYHDVRELSAQHLTADGIREIDLICGGFPCTDISRAKMHRWTGIDGENSGLWREFARLIGEVGPRYVIMENTSDLLGRGLAQVLGELVSLGYDSEWHSIPASALGAPHVRDRTWIVAYPNSERLARQHGDWQPAGNCRRSCYGTSGPLLTSIASEDWIPEPEVGRVVDRCPLRVDRLRSLGNSLVPQIPELIGRAIMECENVRGG